MTRPTTSDAKEMATPIQNKIQFGVGIRATPPTVMPTRATKTAVQAAGDDPCIPPPYPASIAERGVVPLVLRTPEIWGYLPLAGDFVGLGRRRRFTLVTR